MTYDPREGRDWQETTLLKVSTTSSISSPVVGGRYIVGNQIMVYDGVNYDVLSIENGTVVFNQGDDLLYYFNGTTFNSYVTGGGGTSNINDGIINSGYTWSSAKINNATSWLINDSAANSASCWSSSKIANTTSWILLDGTTNSASTWSSSKITNTTSWILQDGSVSTTTSWSSSKINTLFSNLNANNINSGVLSATYGGAGTINGLLKANGSGVVSQAGAGIDYLTPTGNGSGLTALNGSNIASGTVNASYLPVASSSTKGIVQPDNTSISISGGIISINSSGTVTNQGNTFNGISQLVQTNSSGQLPVISGTNLINLNGDNISQQSYADMYAVGTSTSTTIVTAGTYVALATGMTNSVLSGFTFSNPTLTCTVAGEYRINFSMSVQTAYANQGLLVGIMKNGTVLANGQGYTFQSTANFPVTVSGNCFVRLAVGDTIKFAVTDATAVHPVVTTYASLVIQKVTT